MIKTFADKKTAAIFAGEFVKALPREIVFRAKMRLDGIHAASRIDLLRLPPSNRLEALRGDQEGRWSIRVNDQWRICFRFVDGDAYDVEMMDHH
ncbi:MAG: type II toxin-antitoxin system RelE/ParE family toxin [Magnetococcales bacterium]|nr:type II toxin-antitoxin system RelE/ParE family toxin [Magnetococcales bacterium]MBF0323285.1 type II toxin-antitoxin system RelE/ParE family toxin [Magnetococcales bacterium]